MESKFLDDLPDLWPDEGLSQKRNRKDKKAQKAESDELQSRKINKVKSEPSQVVIYYIIRCPKCGSEKTSVSRTLRPIRYHKCGDCGHNFKSVED